MEAVITIAAVIFFVAIARAVSRTYTPEEIGNFGENKVASKLLSMASRNGEYEIFNGVILKSPDGTTQVDHIVVSPFGIFVIETKNLGGWIFGSEKQKRWTQCLRSGRRDSQKYQFQNPLHQNYKHVKAVQEFLGTQSNCTFNIIVFVGDSEFRTEMPDNVLELRELVPYIKYHRDRIIEDVKVREFSIKLSNHIGDLEQFSLDKDNHISSIEQNKANPTCPRCGKKMTLKTAKKGKTPGSNFWGCQNFPLCRATKNTQA